MDKPAIPRCRRARRRPRARCAARAAAQARSRGCTRRSRRRSPWLRARHREALLDGLGRAGESGQRDERRGEQQAERHDHAQRMTASEHTVEADREDHCAQHRVLAGVRWSRVPLAGRRRPCWRSSRRRRARSSRSRRAWRCWSSVCSSPLRRPITSPAPTVTAHEHDSDDQRVRGVPMQHGDQCRPG